MKAKKIKTWARRGEVAYFLFMLCLSLLQMQYNPPFKSAGTTAQVLAVICLIFLLLLAESIVRIIGYFAEILEKK